MVSKLQYSTVPEPGPPRPRPGPGAGIYTRYSTVLLYSTVLMSVEYAVVVVRLVQIQYTCVLEEKTRQNSARIFARVGHGEKGEGDEV